MTAAILLANASQQFCDANGAPLAGGSVTFYNPGTTVFATTWQDPLATIPNENPIILDGAGRALIWGIGQYRQVVQDQFGNLVWDRVTGEQVIGGSIQFDRDVVFRFDNAGTAINPGILGDLYTTFAGTITGWAMQGDQDGQLTVDIWEEQYVPDTPPTVANSITGTVPPQIQMGNNSQRGGDQGTILPLTGWNTDLLPQAWWRFNCVSCTTITRMTLTVKVVTPYNVVFTP